MKTKEADDNPVLHALAMALMAPWVIALLLGLSTLGLVYETWAALTILAWFAPWPMPVTFWQAVGINAAVSLVVRHGKRGKDDREASELLRDSMAHWFIVPTTLLASMWVLRTFLL